MLIVPCFTSFIAAAVNEPIQKALSEAKALSIIFDGATDTSVAEVEIVYCRIVVDGRPKEYFVGLQDLQHAHSEGVVQALDRAMRQFGCDDWLQKLVGTGSDGASVNVGANNSVRTRLQNGRPYVVNTHCVAHRLELGALQAIKNNPMLQTLEEMFKLLHKHYHYSPKALRELGQIADMMEERIIKPTRLQGTRWLPHIMQASKALMNGYGPILAHFEHVSQAAPGQTTAEVKGRATYLAKKLKDWRVIRFMAFFQDLLEIVSGLSLKFQQSSMTCLDFLDALEAANLQLVELGQGPGQHFSAFQNAVVANDEGDHFYRGAKLTHVDVQQLYNFGDVIDSVQERINGRLDNKDNILCLARVFDTRDWPNTRVDLATYGNNNIESLSVHFAQVLDRLHCNRDQLRPQWLEAKAHLGHRLIANRIQRPTIQDLFQDRDRFSHLLILVDICLTLPVSSAICERGFSAVKRIKSDWRSSLSTQMLNHLLAISIEGPSLEDYDAERAVHLWWTRGQRTRRPQFEAAADHVAPGDQDGEDQLLNFFLQHNHLQLAGQ
ncbi:zinc finger protein 862-like [Lingula anatina]|uniref:Zinc finger protein 862-like n=1 Tax=Lingula anatina TaxID=7574 RepID=A0A1S3HE30_LINAN|nr:zinc finger protein 862-like [Lingula anatina]|eukprot:XP_013383761.1 zinc finger protein 862-like [Lingula anatina]